ncbi:MAG: TIGR02996 domain-containing protein [Deltaproteobacteria bacterium]|nr:TIGR02996 domain-containing protein [Deltaproteobacteria bacterium]
MARKLADITAELQAAAAIDGEALLDALLVAYRARPLPELVELITLAGKRVSAQYPTTGSLNDQHTRWSDIAVKQRAVDLEWLLATMITGRTEYSIERLTKIERWPIDPRLSAGLLALASDKQISSRQFWKPAFDVIGKQIHLGLVPILAPMRELIPQTEFENFLKKKLVVIDGKLARFDPPSASTTERAALAKLSERLALKQHRAANKTADEFLREIWATPNDDGLREVFADWLQERGDPRGEFITLQLTRLRTIAKSRAPASGMVLRQLNPQMAEAFAREKALLTEHRRAWSVPFEATLAHPKSKFDRGFLSTAHVHWRKLSSLPPLMTHPAWATVQQFQIDPEGERTCAAWIDHMIALGAVRV